jgi:hypothetical protein
VTDKIDVLGGDRAVLESSGGPETPEPVAGLLPAQFLLGSWSLHRTISDHRAGQVGLFTGRATFAATAEAAVLAYDETGELTFGSHHGPAYRKLLYRGAGADLDVRFADGRPFYVLRLYDERWGADHPCGADLYSVSGRLTGPATFVERWHAVGPARDYDLVTTNTRMPSTEST